MDLKNAGRLPKEQYEKIIARLTAERDALRQMLSDMSKRFEALHIVCTKCGNFKTAGHCIGNDSPCLDDAYTCKGWGAFCCRCGADWAKDQI